MRVILLQDVKSLGKKDEVVTVSNGYARNVLLPRKLGVEANKKNLNDLKLRNQHRERVVVERRERAKRLVNDMEAMVVEIKIRAGEGGRTFGSVSAKEIAEAAKQQLDLELDKKKIVLPEPIKALGMYEVAVKLHTNITGKLHVLVTGL